MNRNELIEYLNSFRRQVCVIQERPFTCVQVEIAEGDYAGMESVGFSKVQYPDEWSPDFGIELALKKAIAKIARQIMEDGNGSR